MDVYSTCPGSTGATPGAYRRRLADIARWTEESACRGMLIFTDNKLVDPWAAAQYVIERTRRLVPLVAAQPAHVHPFTVARTVSTFAFLYGRQVDLNLVTGGVRAYLRAVGCLLDHDERYARLVEYGEIIRGLLSGGPPRTYRGAHYELIQSQIEPAMPAGLFPKFYVAGSSPACVAAGRALGAMRLAYPRRPYEYAQPSDLQGVGIRIGIVAREDDAQAWRIARRMFPPDPAGERRHALASRGVESSWYQELRRESAAATPDEESTYWLYPLRAAGVYCPYLVGSYERVARFLARYLDLGARTLILGVPEDADELHHAEVAIGRARAIHASQPARTSESVGRTAAPPG